MMLMAVCSPSLNPELFQVRSMPKPSGQGLFSAPAAPLFYEQPRQETTQSGRIQLGPKRAHTQVQNFQGSKDAAVNLHAPLKRGQTGVGSPRD